MIRCKKSLTAALVMRAIQTGRLSFNSHLSDFYPQVPGSQQVTIREMMDMTSGLVGPAMPAATAKPLSDAAVIQRAIQSIQFKPAQHGRWSYQQVNFTLLAGIVARVMHQSYANVLLQTLARPLRLHGTHMAYATATGQKSAQGYVASTPERYQHPFVVSAAAAHNELGTGQVFMTPGDLYRVESSLLDGRLLNAAEANALYGPRDTVQYSGGYYHAGMDLLYANGWGYGYETFVRITPDGKNAVIVMSNTLVPYNRLKGAIDGVVQWWLVQHHDLDTIR
ncbi:serine hydrolase domain-containing protein [Lacticaseibacillus thailandensis]|uniref:serine hydrolase domain-containing protein n=1 Tax=Lacticaseibacillus thailandensis TaxID=381741 RepID=UPI00138F0430|nr:serine hydrolase domain-containing protein [Lacticaseibacillus thailandensis]